jgi:hypothetical protein
MTPGLSDISARAAPLVRTVLEDDDVKDHLGRAATAGRGAVARARSSRAPARWSALARVGEAVRETGQALVALSDAKAKRRRARRRRLVVPAVLAGGAAAAVAAVLRRSADARSTTTAGDDRPAPPSAASPANPQDRETPHG